MPPACPRSRTTICGRRSPASAPRSSESEALAGPSCRMAGRIGPPLPQSCDPARQSPFQRGLKSRSFRCRSIAVNFARAPPRSRLPPLCGAAALPSLPAWAEGSVPMAELMAPEALPDMVLGSDKAPVTIVEYASMTCPHCAQFRRDHLPGTEEALHRHRQGSLHLPRIPARPAGGRRLHAGALRRREGSRQIFRHDRDAVPPADAVGGGEAAAAAARHRQAGRLHRDRASTPAWRIRSCSTASKKCASAPSTNSKCSRRRLFSSTEPWCTGALTIEEMAKVIDPLSQWQNKGFSAPAGRPLPARHFARLTAERSGKPADLPPSGSCSSARGDSFSARCGTFNASLSGPSPGTG